jgi:hypothetical protein
MAPLVHPIANGTNGGRHLHHLNGPNGNGDVAVRIKI